MDGKLAFDHDAHHRLSVFLTVGLALMAVFFRGMVNVYARYKELSAERNKEVEKYWEGVREQRTKQRAQQVKEEVDKRRVIGNFAKVLEELAKGRKELK